MTVHVPMPQVVEDIVEVAEASSPVTIWKKLKRKNKNSRRSDDDAAMEAAMSMAAAEFDRLAASGWLVSGMLVMVITMTER